MPTPTGDSLHVSNTNAGANKLDYYLERSIDYSVTVTPSGDFHEAIAEGRIGIELANTVPPSGVPQIAAGPYEGATDLFVYGQNHTFLSVYTPLSLTGVSVNGQSAYLEPGLELQRNVYSGYLDVFAQQKTGLALDVAGRVRLAGRGWYELTLVRQPALRPDRVSVRVAVPAGYRIVEARGLDVVDGVAQGVIELERTTTVRVRIATGGGTNLWDRLEAGR
jgi:hypothetical protein